MRLTGQQNIIIHNLKNGMKFGMYDGGKTCYFENGTRVDYKDLWEAIRTINNLDRSHNKTIFELCPNNYLGTFPHKFRSHKWKNRVLALFSGNN